MTSSHRVTRYVAVAALAALITGFQYGFTLAIIAGAEPFLADQFQLSTWQLGLVVSNLSLGAAVGSLLAGPLSDRLGRRKVLVATALVFLVSAVLSAAANNISILLVSRSLAGLAVGAAMIIPLYVAEISPAKSRGLLVSLVQIGIVTGILAAFCTGWKAADLGSESWRWMFGMGVPSALLMLVATFVLPESPRWLITRGNTQEAMRVLAPVMGESEASNELRTIEEAVKRESARWQDLFHRKIRWALITGLVLAVLSVTVGINAVILYGPEILMRGAGEDVSTALLGAVVLGCVNFAFSLLAMLTIDKLGRKPLLLCGLAGMGISMLVLGLRFSDSTLPASSGLLAPILSFVAFYAVSLGPIIWVIVSEIFPTKIRGAGMAMCMVIMYVADFAVTFAFPLMMERLGNGVFYVFAGICIAGILFVLPFVPETKGKSLEEIETMWSR
ncbi:MAG: sugar porter family MFS transporter [Fuerstiella sp.]|nr:sugar porter family MFS transporter [Fuerstiella sp.]MCP4857208.1 sugar porter family MFS transporter [Fuerstiella sp.]